MKKGNIYARADRLFFSEAARKPEILHAEMRELAAEADQKGYILMECRIAPDGGMYGIVELKPTESK